MAQRFVFLILLTLKLTAGAGSCCASESVRLGIIGLDTSHVVHFTKYINDPKNSTGCRIVAAYPGGSPDIPASADRIDGFTRKLRDDFGVEMVASISDLCSQVDGVLLESVDGRTHLSQARAVIAAGRPLFIDKPVAASLSDAKQIFQLAKKHGVPCWSSSAWRYSPGVKDAQQGQLGAVVGCVAFGPTKREPHHPDLFWYGVHSVETLFAVMGPGCVSVTQKTTDNADVVVGSWNDGRVGILHGNRVDGMKAGFLVLGSNDTRQYLHDAGYEPLVRRIVEFFKTRQPPVTAEDTLEIFAFMTAAQQSTQQNGRPVLLQDVLSASP